MQAGSGDPQPRPATRQSRAELTTARTSIANVPPWLTIQRMFGVAALAALFAVAAISISMITDVSDGSDDDGDEPSAAATATPTRTPKPTPTPKPKPTPVPLTAEERAQRRQAAEQVRGQGFDPVNLRAYHPTQALRVLLGESPVGRRAFFFVGDTYIGTDATDSSAKLRIARQTKNTVTLEYGLASGGKANVRFRWNGTALAPDAPIPPPGERQG